MSEFSFFASALNEAITSSNMSMEYIVKRLKRRGLPISQASLSHWRSGRTAPKRKKSLAIIEGLEEILQLPHGSLSELLAKDGTKVKNRGINTPNNDYINTDALVEKMDAVTAWNEEVSREVMEERTIVSEDFLHCEHHILFLVRQHDQSTTPQLHLTIFGDSGEFSDKTFDLLSDVEGVTNVTYETQADDNTEIHIFRLHLPIDDTSTLHRVAYKQYQSQPPGKPFTESNRRLFAWQSKLYAGTLEFKGEVPDVIEWVTESVDKGSPDYSITSSITRRVQPVGKVASVVLANPPYGQGYWQWR